MNRDAEDRLFRPVVPAEPVAPGEDAEPSIRPEKPKLVSSQTPSGR